MSYYLEPDSPIRDKFKVVFNLSRYVTKKRSDTSNLAAKQDLILLKTEVDKVGINK